MAHRLHTVPFELRVPLLALYGAFLAYVYVECPFRPFPATVGRWATLEDRSQQPLRWVHGVNTALGLELAFNGWRAVGLNRNVTLMIEADIMPPLPGHTDIVMCHPPCPGGGSFAFADWLDHVLRLARATRAPVGLKLDFKSLLAAEVALGILARRTGSDGTLGIPVCSMRTSSRVPAAAPHGSPHGSSWS